MKKIQDEDDLKLLDLYRINFAWYGTPLFALKLFIAWYFFYLSKTLFWIFIVFWIIWIFSPSYGYVRHKIIKEELKRRGII